MSWVVRPRANSSFSFDNLFFGQTPGFTSIVGSTLILGSAIAMAMQQGKASSETQQRGLEPEDEEEGLMENLAHHDESREDDMATMPVQEVQTNMLR